jgi:predicted Fe-Mo cluster-binding NifX family protein
VKIFTSANGSTIDASVGQRFGLSPYFIVISPQTMAFESIPNTGAGGKGSAGIRAEMLAISKEADMVLTGYRGVTLSAAAGIISMEPIYAW